MKRKYLVLIIILQSIIASGFAGSSKNVRGLWVVRYEMLTPQSIDSLIAIANRYQFTDLFVQVRGRGDAYYNSAYEPRAEGLQSDFDPLGYLISRKGDNSFRIHAWINVFYLWSSDSLPESQNHLVYQQPDWISYPAKASQDSLLSLRKGGSEGLYNSPLLPEVQQHIFNIVDDILSKYDVDGIHLDYIRFPGKDFDFHPWIRHSFKKAYILDPLELKNDKENFVQKYGYTGYELYYDRWTRFLQDGLSDFVKSLATKVRNKKPDVIISAAVKADLAKAHLYYYQEWDRWLKKGWLDWAIPMNYTGDNIQFLERIHMMFNAGMMDRILIGISLFNQSDTSVLDKIADVKELSLNGYVLFSYKQFMQDKKLQKLYVQSNNSQE